MAVLELDRLNKSYGAAEVIEGLDLAVEEGSFTVFVGPSGCGKSTLLRMIAGLEEISGGEIRIEGARANEATPVERGVAMVFQNYALYPHMSVAKNIGFGLKMLGYSKQEIEAKVATAAEVLQITDLLGRKPAQLSGGQRQRVAIGRSIVREPKLFLFDEPLSNLDAELRVAMRVEIAKLHQNLGATMIYVTHDQTEALTLADRIVVLRDGKIEQHGTPVELYDDPDNEFVAGFIGSPRMNFMLATIETDGGNTIVAPQAGGRVSVANAPKDASVKLGVRPEHLQLGAEGDFQVSAQVEVVENLGGTRFIYGRLSTGEAVIAEVRDETWPKPGETVTLSAPARRLYLFDAEGKRLRTKFGV